MARTKLTPKKEREGRKVLRTKEDCEKMVKKGRRPPSPVHHPSPARKPSPRGRWSRRWKRLRGGLRRLDGWRKWVSHHHHCPTQQLAQMAAEAGPSVLGEEPAKRKLCPTVGGKAPLEGIPQGWESKEDQEVLAWHSCSLRDLAVPKEH